MPRIPTLYPQSPAAVGNFQRVLNAPAPSGDEAVTTGLGELGNSLAQTSAFLDNVQRLQQQEDMKLDLAKATSDVKLQMADAEISLKQAGTSPDIYERALGDKAREIMKTTINGLKYRESAPQFLAHMSPYLTEQGVKAKHDAFVMKNAELEVGTDTEIDRQTNLAVTAQTPEDRDAAVNMAMGLATNAYTKLIYSKDKMVRTMDEVRTKVETGRIETALRDPNLTEEVLTKLEKGQASAYLPAQLQYNLANQWVDRVDRKRRQEEADQLRLETKLAKEAKAAYHEEYGGLYQRALAPMPGDAPTTLGDVASMVRKWGPVMTAEDTKRLTDAITHPAKDGPSDAKTLAQFTADLMGVNPRATEKDLQVAHDAGLLNQKDYSALLAHRTTRVESLRKEGESDFDREMQRAKVELQIGIHIPPFMNSYTKDQEKWLAQAMSEFNRRTLPERSADRGGAPAERPEAVLREMIPRYQNMMGLESNMQEDQLRKLIDPRFPTPKALNEGYDAGLITPGQFEAQTGIWGKILPLVQQRLLNALPAEEARLTGKKPAGGTAPTGKAPTAARPGLK